MTTLITIHELQGLTDQELGELHQLFTILLSETAPHTPERRAILATLENIERTMGLAAAPASGIKP
ncbi:hypothetical protein [Aquibaculum sediminis]|uniref:hypothetical protein n=1 Tax=Aquibaculum sediminis TaxID=3231907 RepID=UPI003454A18A